MRTYLVNRLRLLGFSLSAFALAIGLPLGALPAHAATPEPRFGEAPGTALSTLVTESERLEQLTAQLAAAEEEIANLRKALELLGPLPEHPELFIPVAYDDIDAPTTAASVGLFHHAELGAVRPLAATPVALTDTLPGYDTVDCAIRLTDFDAPAFFHIVPSAITGNARAAAPIRAW